jgi:hypothetical protein
MDVGEIELLVMNWIDLFQVRGRWKVLVNTIITFGLRKILSRYLKITYEVGLSSMKLIN